MHKQSGVKDPSINTCQDSSDGKAVNTRSENYSPRVEGSIPVTGNFCAEFISLSYNSGRAGRMIYLRKTSNKVALLVTKIFVKSASQTQNLFGGTFILFSTFNQITTSDCKTAPRTCMIGFHLIHQVSL